MGQLLKDPETGKDLSDRRRKIGQDGWRQRGGRAAVRAPSKQGGVSKAVTQSQWRVKGAIRSTLEMGPRWLG